MQKSHEEIGQPETIDSPTYFIICTNSEMHDDDGEIVCSYRNLAEAKEELAERRANRPYPALCYCIAKTI